jgi:hypothetical protein
MTYELNRIVQTLSAEGVPKLSAQGAANQWAAASGLGLLGALNKKNSNSNLGLRAVCNALGGTTDLDEASALGNRGTGT